MRAIELISELTKRNPYPADIFTEPTPQQYAKIQEMFKKEGLSLDGFAGTIMRKSWNFSIDEIKKIIKEQEE
jgi:hypothetical protein